MKGSLWRKQLRSREQAMVLNGHHKPKPAPPSPSSPPPPPLIGSPKAGSALYERARKNGELHVLPGGLGVNDTTPTCGFYRREDGRAPELRHKEAPYSVST